MTASPGACRACSLISFSLLPRSPTPTHPLRPAAPCGGHAPACVSTSTCTCFHVTPRTMVPHVSTPRPATCHVHHRILLHPATCRLMPPSCRAAHRTPHAQQICHVACGTPRRPMPHASGPHALPRATPCLHLAGLQIELRLLGRAGLQRYRDPGCASPLHTMPRGACRLAPHASFLGSRSNPTHIRRTTRRTTLCHVARVASRVLLGLQVKAHLLGGHRLLRPAVDPVDPVPQRRPRRQVLARRRTVRPLVRRTRTTSVAVLAVGGRRHGGGGGGVLWRHRRWRRRWRRRQRHLDLPDDGSGRRRRRLGDGGRFGLASQQVGQRVMLRGGRAGMRGQSGLR